VAVADRCPVDEVEILTAVDVVVEAALVVLAADSSKTQPPKQYKENRSAGEITGASSIFFNFYLSYHQL